MPKNGVMMFYISFLFISAPKLLFLTVDFSKALNQKLDLPEFLRHGISVHIKREDLVFPMASGNKWRKLKHNLNAFNHSDSKVLLTFGGAFSNHLAAVAAMCSQHNIPCIGIVRGDELAYKPLNPTLEKCQQNAMQLVFVSREEYAQKEYGATVQKRKKMHRDTFILPEGGTNALAIKGCEEILTPQDDRFDAICCAVGTGGTLIGLSNSSKNHQRVVGFQVVKDATIPTRICTFAKQDNWVLVHHPSHIGYAQVSKALVAFAKDVLQKTGVLLDPIYTAPMLFQLVHMLKENTWNFGTNILLIHTGGTQGIAGFNSQSDIQWPAG